MDLALPTGRVVVCDPFTGLGPFAPRPFTAAVPPGRYPVTLAVAAFDNGGAPAQVAVAARLSITDAPVAGWELALVGGENPAGLGEREFFGYETDYGDVCFVDASAVSALADQEEWLNDALNAYVAADFGLPPVRAVGPAEEETVAFTTGRGSGFYPTWVGRTDGGDIASFVTDFLVLEEPGGAGVASEAPGPGVAGVTR
ncbi:DUF4241 domain-containing protein [Streptomyces sp. NPDC003688]